MAETKPTTKVETPKAAAAPPAQKLKLPNKPAATPTPAVPLPADNNHHMMYMTTCLDRVAFF
jgi:hypothetical protein